MSEGHEVHAILACKGRRSRRGYLHRPVFIYVHTEPWPLPPGWSDRGAHTTIDLWCSQCGITVRPSDDDRRALIELAATKPGRILYIDGP